MTDDIAPTGELPRPWLRPGHNHPPLTPREIAEKRIEDLFDEAKLWFDGAVVDSPDLADGVANIKAETLKARKFADDERKRENAPFDAGKAAVQAYYNPLLAKADMVRDACVAALTPWLAKVRAENERVARAAREDADAQRRAAEDAIRASDIANLSERAAAEALVTAAKRAETAASRAARETATAGGTLGRATGLRTYWVVTITDDVIFARYVWTHNKSEMRDFLTDLAQHLVRSGTHDLPGCDVRAEQKAV